jgi:hypothetical protein
MRILDKTCVIATLDGDDPWQTERRSSDWVVGDAPPDKSDTMQVDDDDPWTERRSSDWNVGDAAVAETDAMQLALMPVESSGRAARRIDTLVSHAHTDRFLKFSRRAAVRSTPMA